MQKIFEKIGGIKYHWAWKSFNGGFLIKPQKMKMAKKSKNKEKEEQQILVQVDKKLIADCKSLHKKYYEKSRINLIFYYWEIGKRINQEYGENLMVSQETIKKSRGQGIKNDDSISSLVEQLRDEGIAITRVDLCQARRLAIEYKDLEPLINEENINWTKLKKDMIKKYSGKKELLKQFQIFIQRKKR